MRDRPANVALTARDKVPVQTADLAMVSLWMFRKQITIGTMRVMGNEELRLANAIILQELFASLAHESGHRLFHICALADEIRTRTESYHQGRAIAERIRHASASIIEEATSLRTAIGSIGDIGRYDLDHPRRERFSLHDVVDQTRLILDGILRRDRIEFHNNVITSHTVVGSRQILSSVFTNLAMNALESFQSRRRKSKAQKEVQSRRAKDAIVVRFIDNGPGISPMFADGGVLFESGTTTKVNGVGFGLALSRSSFRNISAATSSCPLGPRRQNSNLLFLVPQMEAYEVGNEAELCWLLTMILPAAVSWLVKFMKRRP